MAMAQERPDSPSTWTVQAPHSATPQPYFVPVSPNSSRRYQSSGIDGSPSKDCAWPLTCNLTIGSPPPSVRQRPSCRLHPATGAIAVTPFWLKGVNRRVAPRLPTGQHRSRDATFVYTRGRSRDECGNEEPYCCHGKTEVKD